MADFKSFVINLSNRIKIWSLVILWIPKILPELELKLSKIMAETKVLADGSSPTPSDLDSLSKKIAELQSTVDLDGCELEDGDLRSLNIGKFARATYRHVQS